MRYLLDTHCFLWMAAAPERLGPKTQAVLLDVTNDVFLSAASTWEIAIKHALGKLQLSDPPQTWAPIRMEQLGLIALPIQPAHTLHTAQLPPLHRDPFDRLLVSQAMLEGLTLVTADEQLRGYNTPILWAAT